jgi:hypothetical protein
MALTVSYVNGQGFDASVIDLDDWLRQSKAIQGNLAAVAMLARQPQFVARAKTTDNTAASAVIDLTAQGLVFPAKTYRRLRVRSTAVNGTDSWVQEWEQIVYGNDGTTPKLLGGARLLLARGQINGTVGDYGAVSARGTYSTDTVTNDTAASSSGCSLSNNSTNTITLTHPIARTSPKRITGINNCPAAATASGARHVAGVAATSTTFSLFVTDLATPTAASPAPSDLSVDFFIVPPPSVAFTMATNNVTVTAGYDASDNVYHDIEVFIDRADTHLLAPD